MTYTDLTICNLAIDRVSGDRIDALGEESPLGAFCQDSYPHTRDYVLGKYRWTFANHVALLAQLAAADGELKPCTYKYARPADLNGAVHAFRDAADPQRARPAPYVLDSGGFFWSDQSPLFAEYTRAVPEATWPGWFRQLVVTAFAVHLAEFCQLTTKARELHQQAWGTPSEQGEGGLYAQARNEDSRLAPQRQLVGGVDAGPLVDARRGGGFGRLFQTAQVSVQPQLPPPLPPPAPSAQPFDFAAYYNSLPGD